jgi:hypothetical protein
MGDWRSDAYKLYLKFSLKDKMEVSKRMAEFISSQNDYVLQVNDKASTPS